MALPDQVVFYLLSKLLANGKCVKSYTYSSLAENYIHIQRIFGLIQKIFSIVLEIAIHFLKITPAKIKIFVTSSHF